MGMPKWHPHFIIMQASNGFLPGGPLDKAILRAMHRAAMRLCRITGEAPATLFHPPARFPCLIYSMPLKSIRLPLPYKETHFMKTAFCSDYRHNPALRASLNTLAEKTFGINFESWHQNGFWGDTVIPYSFEQDGRIVSNILVSQIKFVIDGAEQSLIQLGTVMTDEACRGQGLSRMLMERVLAEYQDRCDGVYLYANDSVLDFYPKFGFRPYELYSYEKQVELSSERPLSDKINMADPQSRDAFLSAVGRAAPNGRVSFRDVGLAAFWTAGPFSEHVFRFPETDAYVVADVKDDTLHLYDVFAPSRVTPDTVAAAFPAVRRIKAYFTPFAEDGFTASACRKPDCTFFGIGEIFKRMEKEQLIFPELSHT